jgi:hypothetical protein
MTIESILSEELRHTRAAHKWLAEGCKLDPPPTQPPLRPLNEATTTSIQALPLEQLESLAEALLDFEGADVLKAWLASGR